MATPRIIQKNRRHAPVYEHDIIMTYELKLIHYRMAVTYSNNSIILSEVEFLRNKAGLGGAIFVSSVKLLFIGNSSFIENYAKEGGAITCFTDSNVTIDGGT